MKGRAKMKHKAVYYVEGVGDVIGEEDITISLYAQYYPAFIASIDELTEHIKKNGVAHLSMGKDFYPSLEPLDRWWFSEWARNIGKTIKSPGEFNEYHRRYSQSIVGRLVKEIEHLPNNQQAQKLASAITRLSIEVGDTIDRGTRDYLTGNGKPQPEDLLSDARHGALWDNVEKAIIELSTPRAETPLSKAEIRESEKKDLFRKQRKWCADWLKEQEKDGNKYTFGKAAKEYEPTRAAEFKAHNTGYCSMASLVHGLDTFKHDLDIARFQKTRGAHNQ